MPKSTLNPYIPQGNKMYNCISSGCIHVFILFTSHVIMQFQVKIEHDLHFRSEMSSKELIPTVWANVWCFVQTGKLMFVCVHLLLLHNWHKCFVIFSRLFSFQKREISLNETSFFKTRFSSSHSPIKSRNNISNLSEYGFYYANYACNSLFKRIWSLTAGIIHDASKTVVVSAVTIMLTLESWNHLSWKRPLKIIQLPCNEQGQLQLAQVTSSLIQPWMSPRTEHPPPLWGTCSSVTEPF